MQDRTDIMINRAIYSAIILAAIAGRAAAATSFTHFTGVIDQILLNDSQMLGALNIGDPIGGHFTFDDDPAASFGNDRFAAEVGLALPTQIFNIVSNFNYIRARNNVSNLEFGVVDEFHHAYDSAGPVSPQGPFVVSAITIRFLDADATMFNGPQTFPIALNMDDIERATWSISGSSAANPNQRFSINGTVTAIVIPEPQPLLPVAAATIVLLGNRRRARG
jgi:hypothetical protein